MIEGTLGNFSFHFLGESSEKEILVSMGKISQATTPEKAAE